MYSRESYSIAIYLLCKLVTNNSFACTRMCVSVWLKKTYQKVKGQLKALLDSLANVYLSTCNETFDIQVLAADEDGFDSFCKLFCGVLRSFRSASSVASLALHFSHVVVRHTAWCTKTGNQVV